MTKSFLFEIGTEEIPAGFMPSVLKQVKELAESFLGEQRLHFGSAEVFGTPRRVALLVKGLETNSADLEERHKGPSVAIAFDADHNPSKACMGFARGKGISVEELTEEDGYVYAVTLTKGVAAKTILQEMMPVIMNGLNFPKSMRWGDYEERFVRPVRWFVALLDEEVLPFTMASAVSSNVSRGHRFLGAKEITINDPESYVETLRENYIIVDPEERRNMITKQMEALAEERQGNIVWDEGLLEEVLYLVEYPTALCGGFDKSYMSLPADAIITPMKDHQRYFPMLDSDGKLMPLFITVRNGNADYIATVQAGNERVLRARLDDAKFFFNEDRKTPLVGRLENLKKIVFQEGLGNLRDKTDRLLTLSQFFGDECEIPEDAKVALERAALLAKTDLTTGMVTEFTELQGVMGKEYALLDGEDADVAKAIFEQYLPRFAGDILPNTDAGRILSIVDKIDTIIATFSRGLIPTGSQDPYALRRQTIGVLNILIESGWDVPLAPLFNKAAELLGVSETERSELVSQVQTFFIQRLKNIYLDRNLPHQVVELLLSRNDMTVVSNEGLAEAIMDNRIYENTELLQAYTRMYNLVKTVEYSEVATSLLQDAAEKNLYEAAVEAYTQSQDAYMAEDYATVVRLPETLVPAINDFFETVMVMDKDEQVKNNRLQLVRLAYEVMAVIGDVSVLK